MYLLHECHEGSLGRISEHDIVVIFFGERGFVTLPCYVCELREEGVSCISSDLAMSWIISDTTDTNMLAVSEVDDTYGHLILRQSSCLIRTYGCHCTECLDGGEFFDHDFFSCKDGCTECECNSDSGWESLRNCRDSDRDGIHEVVDKCSCSVAVHRYH